MLDQLLANWPLKLLSMALAFTIWVSVTGEQSVLQDFAVPLDIQLPQTRILTSTPPTTVTVRLRGAESRMRRLETVPMELRVDLMEASPGVQDVQLTRPDLRGVPRGVEVDFIEPDRLRLIVDQRAQRELPVEPVFLGQPPEGFAFYGAQVEPDRLLVEGPEGDVEPLELLSTNPIRLDMRRESFSIRVSAVPEAPTVRVVDPRPLEVRVEIDTTPVDRKFENLAVELVGQVYLTRVSPATLSLALSGPRALVDAIVPDQIRLVADVSGLDPQAADRKVPVVVDFVDLPIEDRARISVTSISRNNVTVRVSDERLTE